MEPFVVILIHKTAWHILLEIFLSFLEFGLENQVGELQSLIQE